MTGPEHYREAERLLRVAERDVQIGDAPGNHVEHDEQVARAQVHATLALAAATVECASDINPPQEFAGNGNYITQGTNAKAWQGVLG